MTFTPDLIVHIAIQIAGIGALYGALRARMDRIEKDFSWLRSYVLHKGHDHE